ALEIIIRNHTREAGVRSLERRIADIARGVAVQVAIDREMKGDESKVSVEITPDNVPEYLGPEKYQYEVAQRTSFPGVATGLAWTPSGGDILFIESTMMPGKGELVLTGQLGDVMKESV